MKQLVYGFDTSHLSWLGGGMTAVFIVCFVGWAWYAWSPANRERMERAARLPLDGGEA